MRNFAVIASCLVMFTMLGCEQSTVRGPEGEQLTITSPPALTLHRGMDQPLEVSIDRKNTTGPVTVSISQLPNGVTTRNTTQSVETDKAVFILMASDNANLVNNQQVKIVSKGANGVQTTQYLSVNVEK